MAGQQRHDLLSAAAAGAGSGADVKGGQYAFLAEATFGGGNIKLQIQDPLSTWIDVAGSSLLANGMVILDLPQGQFRAVATGTTGVTASAWLILVPHRF